MHRANDETSAALIAAAHRLLVTAGPDALTVRRIATEAGISTMNVYSRFGGKDGVIEELFIDGHLRLLASLNQIPTTDDVPDDVINVANAYRVFALSNPTYYGIMFRSTVPGFVASTQAIEIASNSLFMMVERVQLGQQRGDFADCDAIEIAAWLWATCHGMISLELDGVASEYVSWPSIWENGVRTSVHAIHPSRIALPEKSAT